MTVGKRLREERVRLGYTQKSLGEIGGVKLNSQAKYERGETFPNTEYLEKLGKAGVDLVYLVTGRRDNTDKIYAEPGDALNAVLDVQGELGLSFTADQIKKLIELAWEEQLNREQLKASVLVFFQLHGVDVPQPKA